MIDPDHAEMLERMGKQRSASDPLVAYTLTFKGDELTLKARPCGTYARSTPPVTSIPGPVLTRMDNAAKALLGGTVQRRQISDSEYSYRKPQASEWVAL
ncbi:MAG TPA: hypothetical protein VFH61_18000 [Thermoleophilia bacterium]|nr:hypothetical protein [Thermoleophilia bacterium]